MCAFIDHSLQLTRLAYKINNSGGLIEAMEALCLTAKPKLRPLRMIKPVDTRWNSKSHMISRALYLRPVLEDICTKKSLTSQYDTGPLGLTKEEWRILTELSPLLGVRTCLLLMVGHTPQFSILIL
jgi:hypothetical protein